MDLSVESLLHRMSLEYLELDAGLHIMAASDGAARLADDPAAVTPGNDARLAFPEFVGAEPDLQEVLEGRRPSWTVRGICRPRSQNPPLYVQTRVERGRGAEAKPVALVVTLEDVSAWMTELQQSVQTSHDALLMLGALSASKTYVENIFDAMADVLIVTSPGGTISATNAAALALSGYTSPELVGRPLTMLLPGADRVAPREDLGSFPAERRFENRELEVRAKDGSLIPVSFSRTPLEVGDHVVRGSVYVGRDLRQQRQAEDTILRLQTQNLSLQEALSGDQEAPEIVGASPAMKRLLSDLQKVAGTDTTVLVTGETGTGKELVARAIHRLSSRQSRLMVTVNCAALPAGLLESELFGHEKGAFTGALKRRAGRFELADGGSVFLDEVSELPLPAQATLLRVLQEHEFERVGGSQTVRIDVRVIAATNRNLQEEVRCGRFREDLMFRLNVFPLQVPPLRDRPGDIPRLAEHFLHLFARRTHRDPVGLQPAALELLMKYRWPGNVRELANVLERAIIVCENNTLTANDLALVSPSVHTSASDPATLEAMTSRHILRALKESDGVIEGPRGAAVRLGVNPATLRSRMKKLGIQRTKSGFEVCDAPAT